VSSTDPDVRLGDLALGAARFVPRWPRVAHALLTVLRSDPSVATSMGARVERNARRHRDHTALLFEHQQWTWRELNAAANRWAHTLTARGIRRGDCVALLVESRPELLFALVALAKIGAHAGLLNTTLRGDPLKHSLKVLGARTVVVGAELLGVSAVVRRAVPGPPLFVGDDASDGVGCPVGWVDLVEEARWAPVHNPRSTGLVTLGDRVFTIPTSGTTGLPKASVMSHMRWEKAADTAGRIFLDLHPGDVVYVPLPFFHNMALSIGWGAVVSTGAALLMRRRLSVSAFWDDCRRHGVTAFPYIGELPRYLLDAPPGPDDRRHGVRAVVGVGMPADVWEPFAARFGIPQVFEMYSASEANTAFVNPFGIPGSVGFCPGPHALLAWDTEAGEPRRDGRGRLQRSRRGEAGLLIARVTDRYRYDGYTEPTATEARLLRDVFSPGDLWFDTGDLLRKIGWGHAVFVDRVGDTFRWRSENVSTMEVERCLSSGPGVAACAVYGVPVPGAPGRAGMAAIVLADGARFAPAELAAHAFASLAEPAVPVFVRLCAALTTTETYKPRKVALRREGWEPNDAGDPVWVRLPRSRTWVPLHEAVRVQLRAGTLRF
jgi:acyl-CoA synthetase (AMP-forming)/AMP-acid ligase II